MANDGTRAVVDLVELEAEVLVALQKVKIETKTIQPSGGRPSYNYWNCSGCGKRHHRGTVYGGNRCKNCATTTTRRIDTKAAQAAISKAIRKAGPGQVSIDLVAAYTEAGLAEPFAVAMARDESNSDSILDLWEADWWKQYEVTDPLVGAVLDGVLPENDAKWLNTVRSDHPDLVMECIQQTLTVEWSRALLDAGFNGHIDAVKAALKGGEPRLVARIQRLQVDVDHLPMKRTGTPRTQKSSKKDVKRQRLSGHAKVTHQSMEAVLQGVGKAELSKLHTRLVGTGGSRFSKDHLVKTLLGYGLKYHAICNAIVEEGGDPHALKTKDANVQFWESIHGHFRRNWSMNDYRDAIRLVRSTFDLALEL